MRKTTYRQNCLDKSWIDSHWKGQTGDWILMCSYLEIMGMPAVIWMEGKKYMFNPLQEWTCAEIDDQTWYNFYLESCINLLGRDTSESHLFYIQTQDLDDVHM
jgi:hypothetical protein